MMSRRGDSHRYAVMSESHADISNNQTLLFIECLTLTVADQHILNPEHRTYVLIILYYNFVILIGIVPVLFYETLL